MVLRAKCMNFDAPCGTGGELVPQRSHSRDEDLLFAANSGEKWRARQHGNWALDGDSSHTAKVRFLIKAAGGNVIGQSDWIKRN